MSPVKPPQPPTRKQRAAATRRRIVAAATTLFAQRGYQATTMSEIAREAGVAVQTVHFVFHTKAELLQEAFTTAVLGEVGPPPQQEWYRALEHEPDRRRLIASIVENISPILERAAPLSPVIRAAPDEDATAVWKHNEQLRRDGYRHMIDLLASDGRLRKGLEPEQATDILMLILGPDTYQILTHEYGWNIEKWRDWTTETLAEQLLTST